MQKLSCPVIFVDPLILQGFLHPLGLALFMGHFEGHVIQVNGRTVCEGTVGPQISGALKR